MATVGRCQMLDGADVALLVIVGVTLGVLTLRTHLRLRREWRRVRLYPLYAVRDRLIRLVAEGKLQEDDFVFDTFYPAANNVLANSDGRAFLEYLKELRRRGYDPAEERHFRQVKIAIAKRDPEVQEVVTDFYRSVWGVLASWRVYFHVALLPHAERDNEAAVYRDYKTAAAALSAA